MITGQNNLASMIAQYRAQQPQQAPQQAVPQPQMQQPMPQPQMQQPPQMPQQQMGGGRLSSLLMGTGMQRNWF